MARCVVCDEQLVGLERLRRPRFSLARNVCDVCRPSCYLGSANSSGQVSRDR